MKVKVARDWQVCEDAVLWLRIADRRRAGELERALRRVPCLLRLQLSLKRRPPQSVLDALLAARTVPLQSLAMLEVSREPRCVAARSVHMLRSALCTLLEIS